MSSETQARWEREPRADLKIEFQAEGQARAEGRRSPSLLREEQGGRCEAGGAEVIEVPGTRACWSRMGCSFTQGERFGAAQGHDLSYLLEGRR